MTGVERWQAFVKEWLGKIEKNVPVPKPERRLWAPPFTEIAMKMKVGDSVLFTSPKDATNLKSQLGQLGYRVSMREVKGGIRVWRRG